MPAAPIRLLQLHEAHDRDGEPAVALFVPPGPGRYGARGTTTIYRTLDLALQAKRELEAAHASPA